MIKENLVFLREFLAEFEATGSMFPTSQWAAREMTRPLQNTRPPRRILEIGAGTGSVTVQILEDMREGDELFICELNPRFMKALRHKLAIDKKFLKYKDQIHFFEGPIQRLPFDGKFDVIVCALPFLNFDRATVEEIFAKLKAVSHSGTVMTYYEYIGLKQLGKVVSSPDRKKRILDVENFFDVTFGKRNEQRRRVWLNILPISVYTIRISA